MHKRITVYNNLITGNEFINYIKSQNKIEEQLEESYICPYNYLVEQATSYSDDNYNNSSLIDFLTDIKYLNEYILIQSDCACSSLILKREQHILHYILKIDN